MDSRFNRLDNLVPAVAAGDDSSFWVLSHGERAYVALAASRLDLLKEDGNSIVQAVARLDEGWIEHMIRRWQYENVYLSK